MLPPRLAALLARGYAPERRRAMVRWLGTIAAAVHVGHPHRLRQRTEADTLRRLHQLLSLLESIDGLDRVPGFHTGTLDDVLDMLALAGIAWMRTSPTARGAGFAHGGPARRIAGLLRTAVARGLFVRIPPAEARNVERSLVWARMKRWAAADPGRWSFPEPRERLLPAAGGPSRRSLTLAELERLRALDPLEARDRVLLELLSSTGLRGGAASTLELAQVWDASARQPRHECTVTEKNSRPRTVVLSEGTRDAVRALVAAWEAQGAAPPRHVFASQRPGVGRADEGGRPPTGQALNERLRRLCERAGVPRASTHAFRRFVVNYAVSHGASLDAVGAYLGHESASTTYRHYWTDEVHERVNALLDTPRDVQLAAMEAELAGLQAEITRLQAGDPPARRPRPPDHPPGDAATVVAGSSSDVDVYLRGLGPVAWPDSTVSPSRVKEDKERPGGSRTAGHDVGEPVLVIPSP